MAVRGIRNNNPGNIDRDATKWQGMAADQSSDPRFVVFSTPQYGIRALAMTLLAYEHKHGLNTVRGIVGRWAPPVENDTGAYVAAVAHDCGVGPDQVIDLDQMTIMKPLVAAIIAHECKGYAYPDAVIDAALHMAGISDAPAPAVAAPAPPPLHKQPSFVTKAVGGAAVACGAAGQYAPTVKGWAQQLSDYAGAPIIAHAVEILTTLGGVLILASIVASVLKQKAAQA